MWHQIQLWLLSIYLHFTCDRILSDNAVLPHLEGILSLHLDCWGVLLQGELQRGRVFDWRNLLLSAHLFEDIKTCLRRLVLIYHAPKRVILGDFVEFFQGAHRVEVLVVVFDQTDFVLTIHLAQLLLVVNCSLVLLTWHRTDLVMPEDS